MISREMKTMWTMEGLTKMCRRIPSDNDLRDIVRCIVNEQNRRDRQSGRLQAAWDEFNRDRAAKS